jgi:hypothetical protein
MGLTQLSHVHDALGLFGRFFCLAENREEYSGQDGNNSDDDQKFNERESALHCPS